MKRMAGLVAAFAVLSSSTAAARAADAGNDGVLLADSAGIAMPSYSLQTLSAARGVATPRVELAGLGIDGRERSAGIGIVRDGPRTRAALETLLAELGFQARRDGEAAHVETPLGRARIELAPCLRVAGGYFCDIEALAAQLAIDIVFDPGEYTLRVRTAWPVDRTSGPAAPLPADVFAPPLSLSYVRTQLGYRRDRNSDALLGSGEFGGGLGDGYWRSAWFHDSSGRRGLYDYAWITEHGNARYLLGHQVMGLDPLLPSFDLLGAQGVWTNAPQSVFAGSLDTRRLVGDRMQPDRSLRGDGPPGGRAELRINGELVDSVVIPLSGRYAFDNVQRHPDPLAIGQVHLFERAYDSVPLRVEDRSFQTGDRLVAQGAWVQFAGLGVQGNPLGDSTLRNALDDTGAGFWQVRYGLASALTLEAAAQQSAEGRFVMTGVHVGLGGRGSASALVARNDDGAGALRVQTDGQHHHGFWRAHVQEEDAGYRSDSLGKRSQRHAEAGWIGPRWMLSLVGHEERDPASGRDIAYLKPALGVQPLDSVSLSIRPDSEGDYGWLARWAPNATLQVSAFRDARRDQAEAQWTLPRDTRVVAGWVQEDAYGARRSLVAYRDRVGTRQWHYGAGALESKGRFGWLLEAGAELASGTYLSAQAIDDPMNRSGGSPQGVTMWLNLSIDLVSTGSGFTRSAWRADYSNKGSISGRVAMPAALSTQDLAGVPVRVDGDVRAYTDETGRFHIGGLAPGVHRLELDDEKLPLDYAPARRGLGVEVAAGRATPVRFALEARLGLAGRTLDARGKPVAGIAVRLLAADGRELAVQSSDRYGFYRFSELPPGRYRVESAHVVRRHDVELVDRYVFDQDLVLPP